MAEAKADLLKNLANSNRLMIACALALGEKSVADLEASLGIGQPNLSQQLAKLREGKIITARREAKNMVYSLVDAKALAIVSVLNRLFGDQVQCSSGTDTLAANSAPTSREMKQASFFARISERPSS